jgi:hypothetical protein
MSSQPPDCGDRSEEEVQSTNPFREIALIDTQIRARLFAAHRDDQSSSLNVAAIAKWTSSRGRAAENLQSG